MTIKEFQDQILGGKHASVMVCQVTGSTHMGYTYKQGDSVHVDLRTCFGLYKQMANSPNGDIHRWKPIEASMTSNEMTMMNKHFEREFETENAEKPLKIKAHKK